MRSPRPQFNIDIERIIMALLAVACIVLAWQNILLKRETLRPRRAPVLKAGENVPILQFTTLTGKPVSIAYDHTEYSCYVLAIMRPTCPVCQDALPIWAQMRAEAPPNVLFQVISTGTEQQVGAMLDELGVVMSVGVVDDAKSFISDFRVPAVPMTTLVSSGGVVYGAYMGPANEERGLEIQEAILECASSI